MIRPIYGAAASRGFHEALFEPPLSISYARSTRVLSVDFDPTIEIPQFFCCSFFPYASGLNFGASVIIKTVSAHGERESDHRPLYPDERIDLEGLNIKVGGIHNIYINETLLAIPGMVISGQGVEVRDNFVPRGDYLPVLDLISDEVKTSLLVSLLGKQITLEYCRTYFENEDDVRLKFLEALFARVESLT